MASPELTTVSGVEVAVIVGAVVSALEIGKALVGFFRGNYKEKSEKEDSLQNRLLEWSEQLRTELQKRDEAHRAELDTVKREHKECESRHTELEAKYDQLRNEVWQLKRRQNRTNDQR